MRAMQGGLENGVSQGVGGRGVGVWELRVLVYEPYGLFFVTIWLCVWKTNELMSANCTDCCVGKDAAM